MEDHSQVLNMTRGIRNPGVRQCLGFLQLIFGLWISWAKTQTLPNSRIPDTSEHDNTIQIHHSSDDLHAAHSRARVGAAVIAVGAALVLHQLVF